MLNQTNQPEVSPEHSNINRNPLNDHDYCSPNKRSAQRQQQSDKSIDSNYNHLSDSSSSSSLSSSADSSKDLVIEQSAHKNAAKLLAPKNTPSVSRSKLIRPHTLQDMEDGVSKSSERSRRARQTTSVTDKSEWIMGDDQIDSVLSEHLEEDPATRRHRAQKEQDPAFSTYTSSDYSSSDASSGRDSDDNSEDDPDRLWCTCQKPHDGKFMISCDICKDWFHGVCVGVTKLMGDRFTKQGKEWFCSECQEKLRSGIPRTAIPKKLVKKEKKKKAVPVPGKRGRGRPRKSESSAREGPTRVSLRTTRKSSSSLDPKYGVDVNRLQKNLAKSDARSESFQDFSDGVKLKKLIKERKKDFFFKRALQEQQRAARRSELGLGRQTLTANLSDSLDSLATSTSTPSMNNLPTSIKSEHKRPKPNIVLQINTKKDLTADESNANTRIVTAIVRSPKKSKPTASISPIVNDLFTAEPIQINKKVKVQVSTSSVNPATGDTTTSNGDTSIRKRANSGSSSSKNEKSPIDTDTGDQTPQSHKKKRKDSESSTPNGSSGPSGSRHIAQKIKESLESRCKQITDLEVSSEKIEKLATEIEAELNECFKEGTPKYLNKFRSLVFNLRDIKNQGLVKNVLSGEIPPARLVRMSPDELASHELAKWRERENKHSIELIKRDAQLAAQQVIVKKTHKGEEVISAPSINEPDDPTAGVANQEPPTTPTKSATKDLRHEGTKLTLTPSPSSEIKLSNLKMKIVGITSDPSSKVTTESQDHIPIEVNDNVASSELVVKEHDSQVLDSKLGPKQEDSDSNSTSKIETPKLQQESKKSEQDAIQEQPKRFRVSIDTKLDPANLSRLKEPLIKPIVPLSSSSDLDEYTLTKTPPFEKLDSNDDHDDEEAIFDPDNPPTSGTSDVEPTITQSTAEPCWSGTITMPDIAKFSASAKPVSGVLDFMHEEIGQNLIVCGRIAPDHVQSYIKKLRSTAKNNILLIKLYPLAEEDKAHFNSFFDYLYSRNRYGVIQANPQVLKDFYILPVHENSSIPDALKPSKDLAVDRQESNCLIGLLVRSKRPTSSTSNYTPTPIK